MGRPRKNATGQAKEATPKAKAKEPEEEVENLPLTLTRSRRVPKPNPKYMNDVIVPLSAKVAGESSRESSVARSDSSEDTVPASEDDEDEEMTEKSAPKKRGRPRKYPLPATPSTPVAEKKAQTPQTKSQEKKEMPGKRLPDRVVKKTTPDLNLVKRKREATDTSGEESRVELAKKRKAAEEKPLARTPSQQITKIMIEKKTSCALKPTPPSPAKGDVVGVAGTREIVKIVDVSEILNKKHELVFDEPKNKRKSPPEASMKVNKPPPLYTSKILSQSQKAATPKAATSPVTPKSASPRVYTKIAPSTIPQAAGRKPNNNGKLNSSVSRFPDLKKIAPARSAPVIDLTKSADTLEKPQRALKDALMAASPTKKLTPTISRAQAASAMLRSSPGVVQKTPPLVPIPKSKLARDNAAMKQRSSVPLPKLTPVAAPKRKREITTIEMWTVVQLPPVKKNFVPEKVKLGITHKELTDHLSEIRLPSDAWSHHTDEPDESVIFERATDAEAGKKDRIVTFKGEDLTIRIEDSEITLVAAPDTLTTPAEIQTLLQIVNDVSLKNSYVEEVTVVL